MMCVDLFLDGSSMKGMLCIMMLYNFDGYRRQEGEWSRPLVSSVETKLTSEAGHKCLKNQL